MSDWLGLIGYAIIGVLLIIPFLMLRELMEIASNTAAMGKSLKQVESQLSQIDHAIHRATHDDPYMPGALVSGLRQLVNKSEAMRKSLEEIEKRLPGR
jgi:hypothetical protein